MIEVSRFEGGITVKGHANYAPFGQDIVCAGVSTLIQTLIVSIENLTEDEIQYDIQSGYVDIRHGKLSECARALVDSFFVGVELIANEYPAYVSIELLGNPEKLDAVQALNDDKSYGEKRRRGTL